MSEIQTYDCSDSELAALDAKLKTDGFTLAQKTAEKSLLPMEYLRREYSGNAASFVGPKRWTIICHVK